MGAEKNHWEVGEMTVYLVIKQGVYRHEIRGVFSTLEGASEVARAVSLLPGPGRHDSDNDGYHSFWVGETELGKVVDDVKDTGVSFCKGVAK